jgi:hypothetical protein
MCHRADLLRFYLVVQVVRKERREEHLPTYRLKIGYLDFGVAFLLSIIY